jgi:ketosteroid isomerase-like protein
MSEENAEQENVEFILDGYARINAGWRGPEGYEELGIWHPDGEYHVAREDPDSTIHRGIGAIARHVAGWYEVYPDLKVEPVEVKARGDLVFAWVRFSGHGAGSGVPIEMELAHVFTMRDGKVAQLVGYMDKAEGLEAAGLSE